MASIVNSMVNLYYGTNQGQNPVAQPSTVAAASQPATAASVPFLSNRSVAALNSAMATLNSAAHVSNTAAAASNSATTESPVTDFAAQIKAKADAMVAQRLNEANSVKTVQSKPVTATVVVAKSDLEKRVDAYIESVTRKDYSGRANGKKEWDAYAATVNPGACTRNIRGACARAYYAQEATRLMEKNQLIYIPPPPHDILVKIGLEKPPEPLHPGIAAAILAGNKIMKENPNFDPS